MVLGAEASSLYIEVRERGPWAVPRLRLCRPVSAHSSAVEERWPRCRSGAWHGTAYCSNRRRRLRVVRRAAPLCAGAGGGGRGHPLRGQERRRAGGPAVRLPRGALHRQRAQQHAERAAAAQRVGQAVHRGACAGAERTERELLLARRSVPLSTSPACPCPATPPLDPQALGAEFEIDFLNLSYTRTAEDVREARRCVVGRARGCGVLDPHKRAERAAACTWVAASGAARGRHVVGGPCGVRAASAGSCTRLA